MAGDDERKGVGGTGARDRPRRLRLADRRGDLRVGPGGAPRDSLQRLPHPALEHRPPQIDGQRPQRAAIAAQVLPHESRDRGHVPGVFADRRPGELALELLFQHLVRVAHRHPAQAASGGRHEHLADLRVRDRITDPLGGAAIAVGRGRHAQRSVGLGVNAARRAVTRLVDGVGRRRPGAERGLEPPDPARGGVVAGADAVEPREAPLQMPRREPGHARQPREGGLFVLVRVEPHTRFLDSRPRRRDGVLRLAPQARAEAGLLGIGGPVEELDVFAARAPARARRPAVDARGRDGEDEPAVGGEVAVGDRLPAVGRRGGRRRQRPRRVLQSSCRY